MHGAEDIIKVGNMTEDMMETTIKDMTKNIVNVHKGNQGDNDKL